MLVAASVAALLCCAVGFALGVHTWAQARTTTLARQEHDRELVSDCLANADHLIDLTDAAMQKLDRAAFTTRRVQAPAI